MFSPQDYIDLQHSDHRMLFENLTEAWTALDQIGSYLKFRLKPEMRGTLVGRPMIGPEVFVGAGTVIEHGAMIKGPAWIGDNCEIRNGCYIRENVIVGNGAVLGNSCEFKNCILLDEVQVPHFNYVGDSILGYKAHLGAGVILSNVKLDRTTVLVHGPEGIVDTKRMKFGALIGDHAEIGCNAVLSPGSIIGRHCIVYPGAQWRGVLPERSIAKYHQSFQILERRGI